MHWIAKDAHIFNDGDNSTPLDISIGDIPYILSSNGFLFMSNVLTHAAIDERTYPLAISVSNVTMALGLFQSCLL